MQVGMHLIFQNHMGHLDDGEHVRQELELGLMAEPLGFDSIWVVEHHFNDYSANPDPADTLCWLAGQTERIKLATGAFILPWNDPLRVAEKISFLDHISGGRAILGVGRGLARREYGGFGVDMGDSRELFDSSGEAILRALETGWYEGPGPFGPRDKVEIRPRPLAGFRDRLYSIGMSPDSAEQAGRLGARLASFSQAPDESWRDGPLDVYRATYRQHHDGEPPLPMIVDLMYCGPSGSETEELGRKHLAEYYVSVVNHYEIMNEHFKDLKGYETYGSAVDFLNDMGLDAQIEAYTSLQAWGTPDQIIDRVQRRRETVGDYEQAVICRYGSMTFDQVKASTSLFADEVLPALATF